MYDRGTGRQGQIVRRQRTNLGRFYRVEWNDKDRPSESIVEESWLRTSRRGDVKGRPEHAFIQDYDRRQDEIAKLQHVHCNRKGCGCAMEHLNHAGIVGQAESREWRVRDRLTRARYYFDTKQEAVAFTESVSTSEITGEPLARWQNRLVVEKNK